MKIPAAVRNDYVKWRGLLRRDVEFWFKASEKHTKDHCARVLLYCLMMAEQRGLPERERTILAMAAVFHDSRRLDDWYDVGHGRRAADYYKEYCRKGALKFEPLTYAIMAWHDRNDKDGEAAIVKWLPQERDGLLLYQLFKDADCLDRFRLGPGCLDVSYLRTEEGKGLYAFAEQTWETWRTGQE